MLSWNRFDKSRLAALAKPRILAYVAPGRTKPRIHDDSHMIEVTAPVFRLLWPEKVPRPCVGLVRDPGSEPYWTKFRRFLDANGFPYRIVDIHSRRWLEEVEGLDLLVWRPSGSPLELEGARKKLFFLNEFVGMDSYPSVRAAQLYEDKILQTWLAAQIGVPTPKTLISFDEADALRGIEELGDDIVWKIATGSGSMGVERLSVGKARRAVKRAFSPRGRRTYWPFLNQLGYVYAQRLEPGLCIDMRITVAGPLVMGYYRDAPRGDFRASGMNRIRMEALPEDAMEEACQIADRLSIGTVALDFIVDSPGTRRKLIEFSSFITADTPMELCVDGTPGLYIRRAPGVFEFRAATYWLPELALAQAVVQSCGLNVTQMLSEAADRLASAV